MMKGGIMNNLSQRDIVLIPFPYTDLSCAKKRPSLVISNSTLKGNDVICCLITSNPFELQNTIELEDNDFEKGNLNYKSKIKPQRLFTISKERVIKTLAKINSKKYDTVLKEINRIIEAN